MRFSLLTIFFLTSFTFISNSYAQQSCMDFNALSGSYGPAGANSTPGWYDVFHTEGEIELSAQGFQHPGGSTDASAFVSAGVNQFSGAFTFADGVFLKVNPTSTMIFEFPTSDTISFNFIDWGEGNINFAVNNEPISIVSNLADLPTVVAPGVTLIVEEQQVGIGWQGTVTLIGVINRVKIGGDDLGVDNFCQNTNLSQQCSIDNISLNAQPCDAGQFMTLVDFVYADTGSMGFSVMANGTNLGSFSYADLPLTVGPLSGDNTTDWTFVLADIEKEFCTNNKNLGVVDCPICSIDLFVTEAVECSSDSTYLAYLEFFASNASSDNYDLFVDGNLIGTYPYAQIPFYGDVPSTSSATQIFKICDSGTTCCKSFTMNALDCSPANCVISDLTANTSSCNNGLFDVVLNFNVSNPANNGFNLNGNGTSYGYFNYADLPITISDLNGDNSTTYEFFVSDATDNICTAGINIGTVDCLPACDLSNLSIDSMYCESTSQYGLELSFDYSGNTGSSFNVYFNSTLYENFSYGSLPLALNGLTADSSTIVLQICDQLNPDCCTELTYTPLDCAPPPVCEIGVLSLEPLTCDDFGKYNAVLDFDYNNTSTSFTVLANGNFYGSFDYASLPVTIGSFNGNGTDYTIEVSDNGPASGCGSTGIMEGIECVLACDITAVETEPLQCTSDSTYSLYLDFNYSGVGTQFKVSTSAGHIVGTYDYAALPITINNFPSYGATPETVTVQDSENANCVATKTFTPLVCVLPCIISSMTAVASDCDANNMFTVEIDLTFENVGSGFIVSGGGTTFGTYDYSELPITIGPFEGDGMTVYDFFVEDIDNPNCANESTVGIIDCSTKTCEIGDLIAIPLDCDSTTNLFMVELNFESLGTGASFDVVVNGGSNGSYNYADLPVMIGPFFGDGVTNWSISVEDQDSPNCTGQITLAPVNCVPAPCELTNLSVEAIDCTSETTIVVEIDLDFANTTGGFEVFASTGNIGFFDYGALPIIITDYPITGDSIETIIVCDAMNPNCCTEINFASLDCNIPECNLDEMSIEILACDSVGNFAVWLDFNFENTSDSFSLVGNGNNYGTYSYSDLPVTLDGFAGDETTVYELMAQDMGNPNCTSFSAFGPIDCIFVCELSNLAAEPILCTSDTTYSLQLQFDYEDVGSNNFEIFAQGMNIGTFSYDELPLEISDFPILSSDVIQLSVCDVDNPNCCASVIFDALNCDNGCNIFEVIATPFGCDQGEYLVEVNLEYQNVGALGFQIFGNGSNYGNFSYSDLPIILEGFNGDGETVYEFIAIDLLDNECLNFTEIEGFDCTADCTMSNIAATPICEEDEYFIEINFNYNNASANGFMLNGNGTIYGTYDYDDLPVMIGPFASDDSTHFEIVVTDMVNSNCSNFLDYGQVDCTTSSLENFVATNASVSYDFIGDQIMITLEEQFMGDAQIEVYNAAGQLLLSDLLPAGEMNRMVDMTRFASGWYMVRLSREEGQVAHPFIKAK